MTSIRAYSTATPTAAQRHRDQVAVMLAAGRRADERAAKAARVAALTVRAERALALDEAEFGAFDLVGFKVIDDMGKHRYRLPRSEAAEAIARHYVDGDEVEYWPIGRDEA